LLGAEPFETQHIDSRSSGLPTALRVRTRRLLLWRILTATPVDLITREGRLDLVRGDRQSWLKIFMLETCQPMYGFAGGWIEHAEIRVEVVVQFTISRIGL
jgi:hypothetical protein